MRGNLRWAKSVQVGGVSELAVLAPIRQGLVPGELRTYEERLRMVIANLAQRHSQGIPTELDRVSSIHFGRMIIIRPDHYMASSGPAEILGLGNPPPAPPPLYDEVQLSSPQFSERCEENCEPVEQNLAQYDDYVEVANIGLRGLDMAPAPDPAPPPAMRSWLLTLVEFDGELEPYMRNIAKFLGREFDTIFQNCERFPGTADFNSFWDWIRSLQITTDLFYATYPDLSVVRIKQLELFKRRFDAFVARVRSPNGGRVGSMDELFDDFLRENQQIASGFPGPSGTYVTDKPGG